jgi:hypothetical protein
MPQHGPDNSGQLVRRHHQPQCWDATVPASHAAMHVIYMTGYSADTTKNTGPVLKKPMRMRELLDEVSRQLA